MMNDSELTVLSAKAVGYTAIPVDEWSGIDTVEAGYWNPLADDRDAFRLAVRLGFSIQSMRLSRLTLVKSSIPTPVSVKVYWDAHQDEFAATRKAIVEAAAIIGERMP